MTTVSYVPWYNELEWMYVYDRLFMYEKNTEKQKKALARIAIWELRSSDTPISVSITKLLFEAQIADRSALPSTTGNTLQMLYGLAIVRFVNSYVDVEQKKQYAQSIAVIAQKIGIPSEIVNCRHCITHRAQLPSLALLRHTVELSLNYITTHYWEPQAHVIRQRMHTLKNSQAFALGLMSIQLDLQMFSPSVPPLNEMITCESVDGTTEQFSSSDVLLHSLNLRRIKSRCRRFKELAKILHSTPQTIANCSSITSLFPWIESCKRVLKSALDFSQWLLKTLSSDSVILSFLRDWLFVMIDPTENKFFTLVVFVFKLLAQSSANFIFRLVSEMLNVVLESSPLSNAETKSLDDEQAQSSSTLSSFSVNAQCRGFDPCNFKLWHHVYLTEKIRDLENVSVDSRPRRFLAWMRCLLLALPSHHMKTSASFFPFLVFHLLNDKSASFKRRLRGLSIDTNTLAARFLQMISRTAQRVRSVLSHAFKRIVGVILESVLTLHTKVQEYTELMALLEYTNVAFQQGTIEHRTFCWLKRIPLTKGRRVNENKDFQNMFLKILYQFTENQCSETAIQEDLSSLRHAADKACQSLVRRIDTLCYPWTEPGTYIVSDHNGSLDFRIQSDISLFPPSEATIHSILGQTKNVTHQGCLLHCQRSPHRKRIGTRDSVVSKRQRSRVD